MYGALIRFGFPATADNAKQVAIKVAESVTTVWRKVCGPIGMSTIESDARNCVVKAPEYYAVRFAEINMEPAGISLSPWARQRIESWPMVTTYGAALELCLKVASSFCTNSPHVPLLIEQFRRLDICQFDPDETLRLDPQFTMEDFRSERQFQQYSELRSFFPCRDLFQQKLEPWELRYEQDEYGWRDLWLTTDLILIFNMSARAYVISAVCEGIPVTNIKSVN